MGEENRPISLTSLLKEAFCCRVSTQQSSETAPVSGIELPAGGERFSVNPYLSQYIGTFNAAQYESLINTLPGETKHEHNMHVHDNSLQAALDNDQLPSCTTRADCQPVSNGSAEALLLPVVHQEHSPMSYAHAQSLAACWLL